MINGPITEQKREIRYWAWLAWSTAAFFYFYEYFVRVAPSVMESELRAAFSVNASCLGIATGCYYMVYGPLQLVIGPLFDRFGARHLFLLSSSLVFIGCILASLPAHCIATFAMGRLLMGCGSAFAFIGSMYLITVWFSSNRLAFLSGLTTAVGMFGALVGQAPLTKLVEWFAWQNVWIIAAIGGVLSFLLIFFFMPPSPDWEIQRRRAHFDSTPHVMKQFLAGLRIVLINPQTWLVGLVACALFMPLIVFADFWGIHYIQILTGSSKTSASLINGMLYLGWLFGGPCMGAFSDRLGRRKPFLVMSCFLCLILLALLLSFQSLSPLILSAILFFLGIFSSPQVICFIVGVESNAVFAKGTAIALVNMVVMLLGGVMQPLVGLIMDWQLHLSPGLVDYSLNHFRIALGILPLALLIAFLLSLFIRESFGQRVVVVDHNHHHER